MFNNAFLISSFLLLNLVINPVLSSILVKEKIPIYLRNALQVFHHTPPLARAIIEACRKGDDRCFGIDKFLSKNLDAPIKRISSWVSPELVARVLDDTQSLDFLTEGPIVFDEYQSFLTFLLERLVRERRAEFSPVRTCYMPGQDPMSSSESPFLLDVVLPSELDSDGSIQFAKLNFNLNSKTLCDVKLGPHQSVIIMKIKVSGSSGNHLLPLQITGHGGRIFLLRNVLLYDAGINALIQVIKTVESEETYFWKINKETGVGKFQKTKLMDQIPEFINKDALKLAMYVSQTATSDAPFTSGETSGLVESSHSSTRSEIDTGKKKRGRPQNEHNVSAGAKGKATKKARIQRANNAVSPYRGSLNVGNSCYLNVIFWQLYFILPLRNALIKSGSQAPQDSVPFAWAAGSARCILQEPPTEPINLGLDLLIHWIRAHKKYEETPPNLRPLDKSMVPEPGTFDDADVFFRWIIEELLDNEVERENWFGTKFHQYQYDGPSGRVNHAEEIYFVLNAKTDEGREIFDLDVMSAFDPPSANSAIVALPKVAVINVAKNWRAQDEVFHGFNEISQADLPIAFEPKIEVKYMDGDHERKVVYHLNGLIFKYPGHFTTLVKTRIDADEWTYFNDEKVHSRPLEYWIGERSSRINLFFYVREDVLDEFARNKEVELTEKLCEYNDKLLSGEIYYGYDEGAVFSDKRQSPQSPKRQSNRKPKDKRNK